MKVIVTVAFDGDRETFATDAVERLGKVVGSGTASRATVDVRLPDSELEALGPELMTHQEERAVIALWDTDGDARSSIPLPGGSQLVGVYHVEEVVQKDYDRTWPSGTTITGIQDDLPSCTAAPTYPERRSANTGASAMGRWRWRGSRASGDTCRTTWSNGSPTPRPTGTASGRSTTARSRTPSPGRTTRRKRNNSSGTTSRDSWTTSVHPRSRRTSGWSRTVELRVAGGPVVTEAKGHGPRGTPRARGSRAPPPAAMRPDQRRR